ncbi:MAG TPA: response regulator transcription factor, partial [Leptospiraceae bacterium]|nr:response regulator transcription factor [Leptospiraceae bacterium]
RRMDDKVPIFILTARNEEIDRIMGLERGADDYITKPFSIRELKARVDSFFRRWDNLTGKTVQSYSVMSSETELIRGSMKIDRARRRISVGDIILNISRKEFDIIFMLASNPGKVFSREMILREVWGKDWNGYERMIDSHIKRIRSRFEKAEVKSDWVETIWGVGYRFTDIY